MTPSEFVGARSVMGLTQEQLAAEIGLTPHVIAAIERGEVRCPKRIAREMELRRAYAQREAVLASSGLPSCGVAIELQRAVEIEAARDTYGSDGFLDAAKAFTEHAESCPDCKALEEYARQHGPPIPDIPMPLWLRAFSWLDDAPARLPPPLRVPPDETGKGRRLGLLIATAFSIIAIAVAAFSALSTFVSHQSFASWWDEIGLIATVIPIAYFGGLYLAGAAVDATRRIRHRLMGYVVRGGLAVSAFYGSVGLIMALADDDMSLGEWSGITIALGVIGSLAGGMLWGVDRIRGKLPKPID